MSGFLFSRAEVVRDQSHIMDCSILELVGRLDDILLTRVDLLVARPEGLRILVPSPAPHGTLGSFRTTLNILLLLRWYLALVCKVCLSSHTLEHRVVLIALPL